MKSDYNMLINYRDIEFDKEEAKKEITTVLNRRIFF